MLILQIYCERGKFRKILILHNVIRRGSFGSPKFQLGGRFSPFQMSVIDTIHQAMQRTYGTLKMGDKLFPKLKLEATKSGVSMTLFQ